MKRGMSGLTSSLLVVSALLLFRCGLPDPTDPSKTSMSIVFRNAESVVFGTSIVDTVGRPLSIGAALYLPSNFDSISLIIKEGDSVTVDTMFRTFADEYFYDTVWCTRTFTSEGIRNVTLTPFSTRGLPTVSTNVPILPRPVITNVYITFSKNNPAATGAMPVQTYTSGKTVTLPENVFVNQGYRFSGWATTATGPVHYSDKDEITLGTEDLLLFAVWVDQNSIKPSVVHAPSQLIAGKPDTLLFAVDNTSRPDPLTISLLNNPPLDPAVFSIVPTGADSIMIAIAKSAGPTTATIGIITSDGSKHDTSKYTITLINPETALWSTTSVDQNAVEGTLFKLDLSPYLSAANGAGVTLSSDIGTIDNNTWNYTPVWGCPVKLAATITARKGNVALALTITLNVAAGDTSKPQLSLIDPSLDGKKVNSAQISVACKATDAGAGIDSVTFTSGTQKVTGVLQGEDIYSGVISGLAYNTPTQIVVTAIDKSRWKNSTSITVTVTRDSTILDAEPPVIVKTAGPESGSRVKDATGSLTFTVNDNAGVDSVWWTLNDAFAAVVAPSENKYVVNYTFTSFGKNVVKLFAKDKSVAGNKGSQTVTLTYNTEVAAVTPSGPINDATGVSLTPSFTWTGGTDADGDSVFYRVSYGTSATDLAKKTQVLTGKTVTLASTEQLSPKTKYFWQVTAWSKAFPDTVQSDVISFTTLDPTAEDKTGPQIAQTAGPEDGDRVSEATGAITVSVTDPNNVTSVTAKLNNGTAKTLTAGTGNVYTYSYTLSTFGENKVTITAVDGSANSNPSEKIISFVYNVKPTAVTLTTPAANATGVSTSPTFKWNGGDDEDGDGVIYTVNYGTSQASLSSTATVTGKTAIPGTPLAYAKTYYWQVTATSSSAAFPDKIQSAVGTFTTEGSLPTISAHPASQPIEEGKSVTFSVTAGGFGTLSYQWRKGVENITGANGASYTISSVTTSMNNTTYDCVVKNEVGEVVSNAATLTVTAIPTFKVTFVTDGGTPKPDSQMVKRGGLVTKPTTDPAKNGYRFTGWYELNATSGFSFTQTTITANLTIYAGWKKVYTLTYHKNNDETGAVPASPAVYDSGTSVTVAGNTGNLAKTGYRFIGWTTSSNGSGTAVTSVAMTSDVSLYPKWEQITYSITYDKNNGTGAVPTDANKYTSGSTATILPNSGALVSGSLSFAGWSTINGGTYACGQIITITGNLTLYAAYSDSKVMDNDGNEYDVLPLGNVKWLKQNLKTTKYRDGSSITFATDSVSWVNRTNGTYCWQEYDIRNKVYGALYDWAAVQAGQVAPAGWRLATETEWIELFELYDRVGCPYITEGTTYWYTDRCYSQGSTNTTEFSAMGNGNMSESGEVYDFLRKAVWWGAGNKLAFINYGLGWALDVYSPGIYDDGGGYGIRCVKE